MAKTDLFLLKCGGSMLNSAHITDAGAFSHEIVIKPQFIQSLST